MFEDSLLESGRRFKTRRPLTTSLSFGVQGLLVGVVALIPLFIPQALPQQHLTTFLVTPPPPPPPGSRVAAVRVSKTVSQKKVSEIEDGRLRTPTAIPNKIAVVQEEVPPPLVAGVIGGVPGGIPGGTPGGVLGGVLGNPLPPIVPKVVTPPPPQKLRLSSGVAEGNLIRRVDPPYPPLARQARIEGVVKLHATISKDGSIESLRVVSGHKMLLTQEVLQAVRQWRYKPTLLNGEPCEAETDIRVVFVLSGG